jgi:hypothetical protein
MGPRNGSTCTYSGRRCGSVVQGMSMPGLYLGVADAPYSG